MDPGGSLSSKPFLMRNLLLRVEEFNRLLYGARMRREPPVVREWSWRLVVPQLLAVVVAIGAFSLVLGLDRAAFLWGAGIYLVYSFGSRALLARHHKSGMSALRAGMYAEAIEHFRASYRFFSKHSWLDKYRSFTMMSPSAASYREMALLNVAFCHGNLGNGAEAKAAYEQVSRESPESPVAKAALRMIGAIAQEGTGKSNFDAEAT